LSTHRSPASAMVPMSRPSSAAPLLLLDGLGGAKKSIYYYHNNIVCHGLRLTNEMIVLGAFDYFCSKCNF